MKTAIVTGAGGFIGSHLVKRLKQEGYWVRGVDLKYPEFSKTFADEFIICDMRDEYQIKNKKIFLKFSNEKVDEVFALACSMGGAEFIFTGKNDAEIISGNALININTARMCKECGVKKVFFSSSACIYSRHNQLDPNNPQCSEESAYPAEPDSEYGWEKLFSERVYLSFYRNFGLEVRIARFHNICGKEGCWQGGREKAPAAICRKIALCPDGGEIEIWGDGNQTRSFLYIDDCIEGIRRLMNSDVREPLNIGSEEMVSINQLVEYVAKIANKKINIKHIPGPLGVRGRNSDNKLIREKLGWEPTYDLRKGLEQIYFWIVDQINKGTREYL